MEYAQYIHENCGVGWNVNFQIPPLHCHRLATPHREYLFHNGISETDIDEVCYVNKDQWYIFGHESCVGAFPEVSSYKSNQRRPRKIRPQNSVEV